MSASPFSAGPSLSVASLAAHLPSAANPNPSTPAFQDDHQWITAYLSIHKLSTPSYRYMYILWLVVVIIFLIFAVFHWSGRRLGALGGLWSKWSLRRRTWRKQHSLAEARRRNKPHKQPLSLPSNAQLLSIATLYIATILLCFLGPDYIAPGTHVWDFSHDATSPRPSARLNTRASRVPPTSATSQPTYTIPKAWWTAGGRTGTIAFALFPLCVLFALKCPPFALFALPFLIQVYNDKLAFIHRWTGRLIWFVTALHVAFWGVQLSRDKRGADNPASVWSFAFVYDKFVFGWLGFICLTLLVALSVRPVRVEFYETFYVIHIILIPATLVFSALHFPPIGWWCWATLVIWGTERLWRLVRFVRVNGIIGGNKSRRTVRYIASVNEKAAGRSQSRAVWVGVSGKEAPVSGHGSHTTQGSGTRLISSPESHTMDVTDNRKSDVYTRPRPFSIGQETVKSFQTGSSIDLISHGAAPGVRTSQQSYTSGPFPPITPALQSTSFGPSSRGAYVPPPGYAHATLLPGRTIRLRLIPPHYFTWAPGQHVLLTVPSVSLITSHPFTIASVCDEEAQSDERREIEILVRARTGFTKALWSHVDQLEESQRIGDMPPSPFSPPMRGVLLRAYVDGPFGSSIRVRWTLYSTVLVIAGGSGVSFATAILEYACMCMVGRSGKQLGGRPGSWGHDAISQISRVRFVWIVREFSHIQWVASQLRRCMDIVPPSALQVDIFVTNVAVNPQPALTLGMMPSCDGDTLAPPTPGYVRSGRSRKNSNVSDTSLESGISENVSDVSHMHSQRAVNVDGTAINDIVSMYGDLGHEEHVLDLTNFDGEDDSALPGEGQLSQRLRKEGKIRRAQTRRSVLLARHEFGQRVENTRAYSQPAYDAYRSTSPPLGSRPSTPLGEILQSPTSSTALRIPTFHDPLVPTSPLDSLFTPLSSHTPHPNPFLDPAEEKLRGASPAPSNHSGNTNRHAHHTRTRSKFDTDEAEAEDMHVVAERARPGRAKIDRIIADEARLSRGAMVVACCGPTSLTAMVRKTVAAHIDPSRIMRGDMRASITLVSEDFEW